MGNTHAAVLLCAEELPDPKIEVYFSCILWYTISANYGFMCARRTDIRQDTVRIERK